MGFLKSTLIAHVAVRYFSKIKKPVIMKYLNVAEKNDAAKNIASLLSKGNSNRREGLSNYNKIYEFDATVFGHPARMVMTSVSGHLLNYAFVSTFKSWQSCNPVALFDAPIIKTCPQDYQKIQKTLEREIRSCQGLIIWTDCDREGENIGFEVIKVCTDIKPNIPVYRAKFSEITTASVFRALNNLGQPNRNVSDAVDVRQELDLRTGAAFTRLQTLRLQRVFPQKLADKLISYGSCQFPTLGFVVERYRTIEEFVAEQFWKIRMNHKIKDLTVDYNWKRERLFNKNACEAILDICQENPLATVELVESKPKSKWRPLPLDTVELEKTVSRKLRINAKDTMKIAEKLYTQGFISYPRTETNIFPKELNLVPLVEQQCEDNRWGPFAQIILNEGGPTPRQGRKSDQAHPPIHPTKYANNLTGNEQRIYEYIVRHFLACVSKDAVGHETIVHVDIAEEKFIAKGLLILERNYLDVYIYDKWNAKEIHEYHNGDTFMPSELSLSEGNTTPPKLLTEADLIALMEKNGIGTDATHAEHIETIKSREYVGLHENLYFVPGTLGMGLVEGYNNIGLEVSLAKPNLRADFEKDLKLICDGFKSPEVVRREQIEKYKAVFRTVMEKMIELDRALAHRLEDQPQEIPDDQIVNQEEFKPVLKCPKCGNDMIIRNRKNGAGKYLACVGYPGCKNAVWFPVSIENVEVLDESCRICGPNYKKLKVKFKQNPFPGEPNPNTLCIGGCDNVVLETLDVNAASVRRPNQNRNAASANARVNVNNHRNANVPIIPNQQTLNNWVVAAQDINGIDDNPHQNNLNPRQNHQNGLNNSGSNSNNRPGTGSNQNTRHFGTHSSQNNQNHFGNGSNGFGGERGGEGGGGGFGDEPRGGGGSGGFGGGQRGSGSGGIGRGNSGGGSGNATNRHFGTHSAQNNNQNHFGNNGNGFGGGNFSNRHDNTAGGTSQSSQTNNNRWLPRSFLDSNARTSNMNPGNMLPVPGRNNSNRNFGNSSFGNNNFNGNSNSNFNRDGGGDDNIVCSCNNEAILLTVKKEGPNTGRKFYKCQVGSTSGGCDFFMWAAEDGSNANTTRTNVNVNNAIPGPCVAALKCNCNLPAAQRRVTKAGPNTGREFYCCPKPIGEGCKFFKWADEINPNSTLHGRGDDDDNDDDNGGWGGGLNQSWGAGNTSRWNGGTGSNWKRRNTKWKGKSKGKSKASGRPSPYKGKKNSQYETSSKTKRARKCGVCGEEGHTKAKCPNS